jgi:hypothetical protein
VAACAGIRYLRYPEFKAAGRLLYAGLRPLLGAHTELEILEQSLNSAASVNDCWTAIEQAGRALGYSQMTASLEGQQFSTARPASANATYWQMRLNLPGSSYVNVTQRQGTSEEPVLVISFVEILRRILPGVLARLNGAGAEMAIHALPVNSRTRTVMSSDCAAPSVNAATAS